MANPKPHCSVDYHEFNGADLETKGHQVSHGIYSNPGTFGSPPETKVVFDQKVEDVHNTYEDYQNGGADQKGPYLIARTTLITSMDNTGNYVEGLPGVNTEMIVLSGFTPTKTGESSSVVPVAPVIIKVDRNTTGWLKPECNAVEGAQYYGCIVLEGPLTEQILFYNGQINIAPPATPFPAPGNIRMVVTKGRKKEIPGLQKGKDYWIYMYAGNSAGVSPLSEVVQVMCN